MRRCLLLAGLAALISCAPVHVVETQVVLPIPVVYVSDLEKIYDPVPIEMISPAWWSRFWEANWMRYNAVTICYGRYGAITQLSPMLPAAQRGDVYLHEMVHQLQIKRWGCAGMTERALTAIGTVEMEAEAFAAEGKKFDEILRHLQHYELLKELPSDSLETLLRRFIQP
jgi:hypothetical protein